MRDTSPSEISAFYSVIRYVADPFRDEPINIGLVMSTPDGEWTRFRVSVPKTRFWAIGRRPDVEAIERWARLVDRHFGTKGYRGVFSEYGQLSPNIMSEWSSTFGGSIRLSEPRVAVDSSLERLWTDLFSALVRGRHGDERITSVDAVAQAPASPRRGARDARGERQLVIDDFIRVAKRWPTFDERLLSVDARFDGRHASHIADLALMNGHLTGIVQVLPVAHGTEVDVITKRALLLEAAVDVEPAVAKLAVYLDPPVERRDLLQETLDVLANFPSEAHVSAVPVRTFESLEARFGRVLFPELSDGSR